MNWKKFLTRRIIGAVVAVVAGATGWHLSPELQQAIIEIFSAAAAP